MATAHIKEERNLKKFSVIDLFAGCGGLSLGLYLAGWQGVFAIEKNPNAFKTLKYNLIENRHHFDWPEWLSIEEHDINELIQDHNEDLKNLRGKVNLVAGGPPCQGFSMAGKRMEDDVRNQLVFSYVKFIELVQPDMLLFENVKGFTHAFKKTSQAEGIPYSQIVQEELEKLGYEVEGRVIDFSAFGVPQRRKRFILVGIRKAPKGTAKKFFERLEERKTDFLSSRGLSSKTTVQEALSDLLMRHGVTNTPDRPNFKSGMYGPIQTKYQALMRKGVDATKPAQSHSFAHHSKEKIERLQNLLDRYPTRGKRIDGERRLEWGIRQRGLTVLDPNGAAPTITNMPDDYLHYCEPRILTVRECARIQSFPDWYDFISKYTTGGKLRKVEVPRYSQVGNAIPPLFAEQAGEVLKEMMLWTNYNSK